MRFSARYLWTIPGGARNLAARCALGVRSRGFVAWRLVIVRALEDVVTAYLSLGSDGFSVFATDAWPTPSCRASWVWVRSAARRIADSPPRA